MSQPLAVIVIHGLGAQEQNFADRFIERLKKRYTKVTGESDPGRHLVFKPIYWAKLLEDKEDELQRKMFQPSAVRYKWLREIVIHYLADAVAYQPLENHNNIYKEVNGTISRALNALSAQIGGDAPLCVISHSLGTVIASNFFYDLQYSSACERVDSTHSGSTSPLERGETLSLFYSCGTTLPLWSLRYSGFDRPIHVPTEQMKVDAPNVTGEWINFYDKDDILGYPLKPIHEAYEKAVREDIRVNVGGWLTGWTPLSHNGYFNSSKVINRMVEGLSAAWKQVNLK
ncbi:chemotaxis protein [Paenibacillus sp. NEAU-GSW1]|uniref:chemotaxis protein n=1 Tax=Paenibacillus sp. NEAU-GSW1 TaxID=2682486 RepID=UPI0012E28DD2|nr:chemotaxis protein [Paenibacillus sp. NEAU-GSW1]MUT68686.1 chemotaxis protein [Paenibacillus sp. NEAU-GSW1]